MLKGTDVRFYKRGSGSTSKVNDYSSQAGTMFQKNQDITGNVSQITVAVPSGSATTNTTSYQIRQIINYQALNF